MAGISTNQSIAVVENNYGGLQIGTYSSKLEMVKDVIDNGTLGGGVCHGSKSHYDALAEVGLQVARVRENIRTSNYLDALRCSKCSPLTIKVSETGKQCDSFAQNNVVYKCPADSGIEVGHVLHFVPFKGEVRDFDVPHLFRIVTSVMPMDTEGKDVMLTLGLIETEME